MNTCIFEIFIHSTNYYSEVINYKDEGLLNKYCAYMEQSVRELYPGSKVTSKKSMTEIVELDPKMVDSLERNLLKLSKKRAEVIEITREISEYFPKFPHKLT
jgi:hypothetical protein